ncbi:haloacid dehalogenase [Sphaerisporangium siamense]|uniref:Cation-transporting ATPase I n=1 Tax=Sphaerisporangium siamense TaxID=795645 RepID=A0A7W7GBB5_9ACTN|nr:cation-transporting P-type ATPase [Sphaerisporangium siamense]MBB4700826.1 cation-transporting ATPase I [Sphaerisporangium siamense]GII86028.1 haloacid dehalogenase [Sphaerisporangium siamense]
MFLLRGLRGGLRGPAAALASLLPDPVRELLPCPRRVHACAGGLRVELRHVGGAGGPEASRALEKRLLRIDGVTRAEVNGALGFVFAGCDPRQADVAALVSAVDELDVPGEGDGGGRTARHAVDQQARALVELGAGLAGMGLTLAGQVVRVAKVPATLPALLQLAEAAPRVRHEVERRVGRPTANVVFATTRFTAQTLALRPLGMLIESLAATGRLAEARAGLRAWHAAEERLAAAKGSYRHLRPAPTPRPVPLPYGPIERYADSLSVGALASYGVTSLLSAHQERALAMLVSATPRAARLGRDAFVSSLGRAAAHRGGLVLDRDALRGMDRVDTVVFDADALTRKTWTVHEVIIMDSGVDVDELHARIYTMLEGADATRRHERDDWVAEPLAAVPATAPHWSDKGVRPVAVTLNGRTAAFVGVVPETPPWAEALVGAARSTCAVVLAGGHPSLSWRLGAERSVPGGDRLARSVRALQEDGHAVAVVAARPRRGLREADLGIGLIAAPDRTPWDAHVIGGPEIAHMLLTAFAPARVASRRGMKVSAAGAAVGAGLTVLGPAAGAVRRVQLAGDCASLAALATGAWSGRDLGRGRLPERAGRTPWHALPASDVLERLSSCPSGLTAEEAASRVEGPRPRPRAVRLPLLRATAEELANPLTPVLATAAGVSASVGSALDAVLIAGVLAVNGLIGGAQRHNADRALHRLTGATAISVRVRRPSGTVSATADDLVPGDVIELRSGDAVPADCRVLKARGVEVDEAPLTGESRLVAKSVLPTAALAVAERSSMVYQGTTVAAGECLAVVVATGPATEARRMAEFERGQVPPTGVELRLRALSRQIMPVAVGSGVLLMATNLLRRSPLASALAPAVNLAVAAVPEGLPFIATVAELAAAKRLSTRETLVRNPSTIEALGRVDVLCFDKTGTLTQGHISLRGISDGRVELPADALPDDYRRVLAAALRAGPKPEGEGVVPHPTDRAVMEGAARLGVDPTEGLPGWRRVAELPFESARGYHAVLGTAPASRRGTRGRGGRPHVLTVKGAPEVVLTRCGTMLSDGQVAPLDDEAAATLAKEVDRLAQQGLRVLAVAERAASGRLDLDESRIDGLCFLGFLGLADPVRPTAARSVARLARAGVRIVMITGDHPSTAEAIAAELNVVNGPRIMTGPQLDRLDDAALAKVLPEVSVFARVTPAHKARIVAGLQRAGKVVAVTGDGANDAPAIRLADVGVALGSRATPAARASADVVVTDDRIETIVEAIVEGRAMWSSVRDALGILLGGNLGEIVFTVGSNLLAGRNTLNARQLLLVNLLTDMLPALAVAVRPPSATSPETLLSEGPEASLGEALNRDIYARAATTAAAASLAWTFARYTGTASRADTVGLIGLVVAQLAQTVAAGGRDRTVLLAASVSLASLFVVISVPGLSHVFGCRPVGPVAWGIGLAGGTAAGLATRLLGRPGGA